MQTRGLHECPSNDFFISDSRIFVGKLICLRAHAWLIKTGRRKWRWSSGTLQQFGVNFRSCGEKLVSLAVAFSELCNSEVYWAETANGLSLIKWRLISSGDGLWLHLRPPSGRFPHESRPEELWGSPGAVLLMDRGWISEHTTEETVRTVFCFKSGLNRAITYFVHNFSVRLRTFTYVTFVCFLEVRSLASVRLCRFV